MTNLNGVFIIPTGLGCALGGDAAYNPGVKLIAACSKNLVVNPNAVNASDINEMPSNCLYGEGSTIDRFLVGSLNLRKTKTYNKILMVVNEITPFNTNIKNSGVWGLGADITLLQLYTPLKMRATMNADGTAGGIYSGVDELVNQVHNFDFDALAVQTPIDSDSEVTKNYWKNGGVNPWGGIEALVSKQIANKINRPIAHAPTDTLEEANQDWPDFVVKKSMSPEVISNTFMFCVLKGLHRAPRLEFDLFRHGEDILSFEDIDFMVSPHGCFGRPHIACLAAGIPIIVVNENTTCFSKGFEYPVKDGIIFTDTYLSAAGIIMSMTAGVDYKTVLL